MNIPIIRPSTPDHRLSDKEMIQKLVDTCNWLSVIIFGERSKDGKLIKDEYKDKDGNVKQAVYHVGLLHKIEGVKDFNEETKEEIILQPGMEQLWQELRARFDDLQNMAQLIAFNQKIQTAMFATIQKITPEQWFALTEDKNQEMNNWMTNYGNIMAAQKAKDEKEAAEQAEKTKDLQV